MISTLIALLALGAAMVALLVSLSPHCCHPECLERCQGDEQAAEQAVQK
ncbi:MAG: hypothetical protein R3310_12535 [Candidatus Competibacteraceae bacterium]|nr:hypothetical protein [Candidatus Competibacteraceae bacterium]